jgi:hypothetical protein
VKGCLFTLVLGAAVIAGLVVFALPRATEGLIAASLTAGGLQADQTDVRVTTASPLDLLQMRADRVTIVATGARLGELDAERVQLELHDVDLGARTAARLTGTVDDGTLVTDDGRISIPTIALEGDSTNVVAVASVDGPGVEALIAERVADATGQPAGDVTLTAPDGLVIAIGGLDVPGTLDVNERGALEMTLLGPIAVPVELLAPSATPLDLRAVRVAGDRLVLEGDVDAAYLGI